MVYKILGTERKSGEFADPKTGKLVQFDNIYLHCSKCNDYSSDKSFGFGVSVKSIKIKNTNEKIESVFGSILTRDDLQSLVGQKANIFFDENQTVDCVTIIDDHKAAAGKPAEKKGA